MSGDTFPVYLVQQSACAGAVDEQAPPGEWAGQLRQWMYRALVAYYGDADFDISFRYNGEASPQDKLHINTTTDDETWTLTAKRLQGRSLEMIAISPLPPPPGLKVVSLSADELVLQAETRQIPSVLQIGVADLDVLSVEQALAGVEAQSYPLAWSAEPLWALVTQDAECSLDSLVPPGAGEQALERCLQQFFAVLFGANQERAFGLSCAYAYPISAEGPWVSLPALLVPRMQAANIDVFARSVLDWQQRESPPSGGRYVFGVTLYSAMEEGRPLMQISRLTLSSALALEKG